MEWTRQHTWSSFWTFEHLHADCCEKKYIWQAHDISGAFRYNTYEMVHFIIEGAFDVSTVYLIGWPFVGIWYPFTGQWRHFRQTGEDRLPKSWLLALIAHTTHSKNSFAQMRIQSITDAYFSTPQVRGLHQSKHIRAHMEQFCHDVEFGTLRIHSRYAAGGSVYPLPASHSMHSHVDAWIREVNPRLRWTTLAFLVFRTAPSQ